MKPSLFCIGVAASFISTALLANDLPTENGIPVITLDALSTVADIDATKRELAHLQEQLEVAQTRGELSRALANNQGARAGDDILEALQRDLQGLAPPPRNDNGSYNVTSPAPPPAAAAAWSTHSTAGFNGDMRAVVVSAQGQQVSVRVGTELNGGGRVVEIGHRTVKVRKDGTTTTLPAASAEMTSETPPVRSYEPFSRNTNAFGGGGFDASGRGQ